MIVLFTAITLLFAYDLTTNEDPAIIKDKRQKVRVCHKLKVHYYHCETIRK